MALPAGSFSLHHERAIHRSAPNNADHRRVGIGLNVFPPHVKVDSPHRCKALLVRGQDRYGYFDLIDPPKGRTGRSRHRDACGGEQGVRG